MTRLGQIESEKCKAKFYQCWGSALDWSSRKRRARSLRGSRTLEHALQESVKRPGNKARSGARVVVESANPLL